MSIDHGNMRVAWGICRSNKIYTLLVENQQPTDIIEIDIFGKKEYFWFYENIKSDEEENQKFDIRVDEKQRISDTFSILEESGKIELQMEEVMERNNKL